MFSPAQIAKALAVLIFLSGCFGSSTIAWSQSTEDQSQTTEDESQSTEDETADTDDEAADTDDEAADNDDQSQSDTNEPNGADAAADPESSENETDQSALNDEAEVAELDTLLLGPWVILSDDAATEPNDEALDASIARCSETPKFEQLDIEPAAEKELPDQKSLMGDLVYYRTDAGLQRIDMKSGKVELFSEIKKVVTEENNTFWAIRGSTFDLALKFANTKDRGGQGQFMLENQRVFLKCGPGPDSNANSDPDTDPEPNSDSDPSSESSPTDEEPADEETEDQ